MTQAMVGKNPPSTTMTDLARFYITVSEECWKQVSTVKDGTYNVL